MAGNAFCYLLKQCSGPNDKQVILGIPFKGIAIKE